MHYIRIEEVQEVLASRTHLASEVEKFWIGKGLTIPLNFSKPVAVVSKHAKFRIESAKAITMAETCGLDICWLTYDKVRFSEQSSLARSLVHPLFTEKCDKNGNFIPKKSKLVSNIRKYNMTEFTEVKSDHGESVIDLHKQRLQSAYPQVKIVDMSDWSKATGGKASDYYELYLSLFIAHAVLFEDYHGGESGSGLSSFTEKIFEPNFEKVTKRFEVKPILVKLPWETHYAYHPTGELFDKWRDLIVPKL